MLKIFVARHGQDEDNAAGILNGRRDKSLTDIGIKQAGELSQKIKDLGITFDKIYSSPLQRAHKTAEIVADFLKLEKPVKLDDLIEREFGDITGKLVSKIPEMCPSEMIVGEIATYCLEPKGSETFPQLVERATGLLAELSTKHPDDDILLVTHGDYGKMLYTAYYNLNWRDVLKGFHFGNSDLLELSKDIKPKDAHVVGLKQYNH